MKKVILLLTLLVLINGCNKDENINPTSEIQNVSVENATVKTFQMVTLNTENVTLKDSYIGEFGGLSIEIKKSENNTLIFLVPEIENGTYSLVFDLGKIDFNVTQTVVANYEELVSEIFSSFDDNISNLDITIPLIVDEIPNATNFHNEVQDLFNSLTDDDKRLTALYIEANKGVFNDFSSNVNSFLNGSTTFSKVSQSDCPTTNFINFYSCTANNLATSSIELVKSSRKFFEMLALAGVSTFLSPASLGISLAGAGIAVATAVYILFDQMMPAFIQFKSSLIPFLRANWILTQATFETVADAFSSENEVSLNIDPQFRTISSTDNSISEETGFFISSFNSLQSYWNRLTALFGNNQNYQSTTEIIELENDEITITNISNSDVELISQNGQLVKFKNNTYDDLDFTFDVQVNKEGFTKSKTINATISAFEENDLSGTWWIDAAGCADCFWRGIEFNVDNTITFTGSVGSTDSGSSCTAYNNLATINNYSFDGTNLTINTTMVSNFDPCPNSGNNEAVTETRQISLNLVKTDANTFTGTVIRQVNYSSTCSCGCTDENCTENVVLTKL